MKTTTEWKKMARLLKEVYAKIREEAIISGMNILSPEYDELINIARLKILENNGWTLEEYRTIKEQIEGVDKIGTLEVMKNTQEKVREFNQRLSEFRIPTEEEIEDIAEQVARKYIVAPVIKNEIVKEYTIEKPRIIETTRVVKEKYDDTKINKRLDEIKSALKELKIPEPYDDTKLKEYFHDYFSENFEKNINILGMPDFRKLAMGLQQQIDERILGVNTHKLTVSATEPTNPALYDLWVDIS